MEEDCQIPESNYNSTPCSSLKITFPCALTKTNFVRNGQSRKSGINCSSICGNCTGIGCDIRDTNIIGEDLEEEDAMFEKE